jgi:DNA-directed RNA polymerase specialized sigma24 family protein
VLRFYEDLSVAQTAELMGCSVGAVKSHVSMAVGKHRERMGPAFDRVLAGGEEVIS